MILIKISSWTLKTETDVNINPVTGPGILLPPKRPDPTDEIEQ